MNNNQEYNTGYEIDNILGYLRDGWVECNQSLLEFIDKIVC